MREIKYNRARELAIYLDDAGMWSVVFVASQDVVAVYDTFAEANQLFIALVSYKSVG